MNLECRLLDLFSGIGGFHYGLKQAGFNFKKSYASEIDKYAKAVYQKQFPQSQQLGSVEHVREWDIEQPDIITFGSPCQDFSVAGAGRGLEGKRSGLITHALDAIRRFRPKVFIWENVKGVYSSNSGADLAAILQAFTNIGGYRLEWQLLNTSWFLPQNRERIYLVGHLTGSSFGQVFPIGEELSGVAKRPKLTANCLTGGGNSGGMHSSMTLVVNPKQENGKRTYQHDHVYDSNGISPCLCTDGRSAAVRIDDMQNVYNIRRLTEIECERLHGFPDNYTELGDFEGELKPISATQRYKMTGNTVSPVITTEIGRRLLTLTKALQR